MHENILKYLWYVIHLYKENFDKIWETTKQQNFHGGPSENRTSVSSSSLYTTYIGWL